MQTTTAIPRFANYTETDFRAEVIAASLLQYYDDAGGIFIKRMGSRGRAKKKDIARIREDHLGITPGAIVIETNRESIYDYMPEGIFHTPTLGNPHHGTENIIEAIRRQRRQEADNRLFFSPFEQEAALLEMQALYREQQMDNKGMYDDLLEVLYPLWPLLEQLDKATAKIFIYLLPFFYRTTGNKHWFIKTLQALLGFPVTITDVPNREHPELLHAMTAQRKQLGISTVLCGSHFDGNMNWQLTIGPVSAAAAAAFLPGSRLNLLLQALYENFVPEGTQVLQKISIQHNHFHAGRENGRQPGFLGYTTFL